MFPLEDQVWTEINPQRRAALAANGGTLTGPQFFTTSFMAYLRPDGIRFVDYFPWITLPAHPAPAFDGAFVDQAYRTGSVTAFMPLFLLLTVVAAVARPPAAGARRGPRAAGAVRRGGALTGGVMGYGYYATRYTSEFVPAMVLGGAIGTALLARCAATGSAAAGACRGRRLPAAVAAFSIVAQMATGAQRGRVPPTRGEPLERYLGWQQPLHPAPRPARRPSTALPTGGQHRRPGDPRRLRRALPQHRRPVRAVGCRSRSATGSGASSATADCARHGQAAHATGTEDARGVDLEVTEDGRSASWSATSDGSRPGDWFDLLPTDGASASASAT